MREISLLRMGGGQARAPNNPSLFDHLQFFFLSVLFRCYVPLIGRG